MAQGADARTVRCAPTLGEAPLLAAPPNAWGKPQEPTVGDCSPSPTAARLAHARILRLREVKKLTQGHTASKRPTGPGLRTHLARSPPHTARPAAAAETAAQCAGASRAGRAGRRRGRQLAGSLTKPPFFPRAPPSSPPSSALAALVGGSARSRDPLPSLLGFRATAARARTSEVGQGSADGSPGLAAGRAEGAGRERWRALWIRRMES